jgi:hypothetical protein
LNTGDEVAKLLSDRIQPRTFINLNFGNLLLEFYSLSLNASARQRQPTDDELSQWASTYLKANLSENRMELLRFYKAYTYFKTYLLSKEPKQLRHIAHALSEPGVITENGLNLIVLEYNGNPASKDVQITVRCPLSGFDIDRYSKNDVAFITHDSLGFWEPVIYVHKKKVQIRTEQEGFYKFTWRELATVAPPIVRDRISEFTKQCSSSYRGIYTSQPFIDSRLLVPVSTALKLLSPAEPIGIIRDAYNHLVAVTVASNPENPKGSKEIVVPVADDGIVFYKDQDLRIHISWKTVNIASASDVARVYGGIINNKFVSLTKQYVLMQFLREGGEIAGFQLGVRGYPLLTLPCGPGDVGEIPIEDYTEDAPIEFAFEKDVELIFSSEKEEVVKEMTEMDKIEMLYQTFRLMFANWLATDTDRASIRGLLKSVYTSRLPIYEKRQRLEILLGPLLKSWLIADSDPLSTQENILRVNCLEITDQGKCSEHCKWLENKCLLHVSETSPIGTMRRVQTESLFIMRLIDELLRLPFLRNELMEGLVKKIQVPKHAMQMNDQYILPESVPEYEELFQKICKESRQISLEQPVFYEEFSRAEGDKTQTQNRNPYEDIAGLVSLPAELATMLDNPDQFRVRIVGSGDERTNGLASALEISLSDDAKKEYFLEDTLKLISIKKKKPIIQILLNPPSPEVRITIGLYGKNVFKDGVIVIIPDMPDGPGILVVEDQLTQSIPIDMLNGEIRESLEKINPLKGIVKKKIILPPVEPEPQPEPQPEPEPKSESPAEYSS